MTEPNTELPRLAPGTYLLTKRVVVKEDGLSEFVDEPEGEYIKGFWPRTRTRVTPVVDEETNLKPDTPRVSMEELRERIASVVDDYTAGEDYGSGPTRYYLTVGTPDELTAHVAAALFPGLDWLFKAVGSWQQLWDSKEEWEQAAKDAWRREATLTWLHAEAIWHAERHRADVDTRDLSLALQRAGFRSMKDQVDAMARKIKALQAQLDQVPSPGACSCNPTLLVLHESGSYCGDSQAGQMTERILKAMQGDNFVSMADAKRIDDVELEAAEAIAAEIQSWGTAGQVLTNESSISQPVQPDPDDVEPTVAFCQSMIPKIRTELDRPRPPFPYEARQWMDEGARVECFSGKDPTDVLHEGWIIGMTEAPTVRVQKDDGRIVSWVLGITRRQSASAAATEAESSTLPRRTLRLRECVERWPDCEEGAYHPSCCRFPSSCSATVYDETQVKPEDLEARP